ncbi:L-methionine sulfoximine/L-methionine sulfone acetyltransferase [bacterium HR09]|nr:L-methionine sulfoximine/L-methionine sulfone acetyltransferase [bacterium HR09]
MARAVQAKGCQGFLTGARENYTLALANVLDVPALYALDRLCFAQRAWSWEAWFEVACWPEWTCLVQRQGKRIIGAMVLLLWPPVAQISSIAVHPAHRGRGLGSRMLAEAIARARRAGCRWVALEVDRESPAVRLYRRFGFGVVRRFTEDGILRLEMVRRLGGRR